MRAIGQHLSKLRICTLVNLTVSLSGVYSAGILTHGPDVVHIRICPSLRNWLSPYHSLEFFDVFKKSKSVLYVLMRKELIVFSTICFFNI